MINDLPEDHFKDQRVTIYIYRNTDRTSRVIQQSACMKLDVFRATVCISVLTFQYFATYCGNIATHKELV